MRNPFRRVTTELGWRELCGYIRFGDHEIPVTDVKWTKDGVTLNGKVHLKKDITMLKVEGEIEWIDCLGNSICHSTLETQSAEHIGVNTTDLSLNIRIEPDEILPMATSSWVLAK